MSVITPEFFWVSIDPGKGCQGVALWWGESLVWAASVWETKTGAFFERVFFGPDPKLEKSDKYASLYDAWCALGVLGADLKIIDRVVVEQSSIKSIRSTMVIAETRGLILGWMGWRRRSPPTFSFVEPSVWQGASKPLWDLVWPKGDYKLSKATSVSIASQFVKLPLKGHDDLADAICVGLWYIGTGQVRL